MLKLKFYLHAYYPFYVLFLNMKKILIIRLSSIGDIVLTSPVIRCLKQQSNCELHYLTKIDYKMLLSSNPNIDKLILFKNDLLSIINQLKSENYNLIIDLQNNIRSYLIKLSLNIRSYAIQKNNFKKLLFIYFGIDLLNNHVVDTYFYALIDLGIFNDKKGLDYFLPHQMKVDLRIAAPFIAWSIGASFDQKKLSKSQIIKICNKLNVPIVLLGGNNEKNMGEYISKNTKNTQTYNLCGNLSLNESAFLIKKSKLVLTNDTGMMHIACAFKKKIISFWGCTKPKMGFSPYQADSDSISIVFNPSSRPCSRHGRYCRFTKWGCIKKINVDTIYAAIQKLL